MEITTKKEYRKKPDLKTKVGVYYSARKRGLTKKDAELEAYGTENQNSPQIEGTKTYQAIDEKFAETLETAITLKQTAQYHADNIKQERDRGARNTAIRMKYEISGIIGQEKEEKEDTSLNIGIILTKENHKK